MTVRFRKIDDKCREVHHFIRPDDECYFLYEYTSGQNYAYSETNSIISNLKKKPSQRNTVAYRYKTSDMERCAKYLGEAINEKWLKNASLVPIPPSKMKTDPEYDDRMLQICRAISTVENVDVRELVYQTKTLKAAHESPSERPTVEDIKATYSIDENLLKSLPANIGVVDDVLTAGAHFRAMKDTIVARCPNSKVVGFFIARRIFANPIDDEQVAE